MYNARRGHNITSIPLLNTYLKSDHNDKIITKIMNIYS